MNIMQPSIDSPSASLSDWLSDAVALVQRVNARLKSGSSAPDPAVGPVLRHGRQVLTDNRCLELAALSEDADH